MEDISSWPGLTRPSTTFSPAAPKTWMPGSRPGMTSFLHCFRRARRRLCRDRIRHVQERARHVPEQLPVDGEHDRVRGARQDDELAVAVRQLVVKFLEVRDGGDAVIF